VTRDDVRKLILKALYGDSLLSEQLVLKGGNALALAYRVGGRTSLDLDFSIEGDFDDLPEVSVRMERALTEAFSAAGIRLFDFQLES
jgi:predicted nucleotidyltransferase component of viral defense system